jgi:hypothetical protein
MLIGTLSLVFLALCVVTVAVGIRSYFASDSFFYSRVESVPPWIRWFQGHVMTGRGGIGVMWGVQTFPAAMRPGVERRASPSWHLSKDPAYPDFRFDDRATTHGFNYGQFAHGPRTSGSFAGMPGSSGTQLIVPLWCPFVLFALLAVPGTLTWHRRRRARWRQRENRCASCGYDLRASGGRCPECGTARDDAVVAP